MPQTLENARGSIYTLPRGLFITGFDRPKDVQVVQGGLGGTVARTRLLSARGHIEGTLRGRTYAAAQAELDALMAFLHFAPIKVRLHSETGRYLVAHPEGTSDAGSDIARAPRIRIPLVAPQPWWVGDAQSDSGAFSGTSREVTIINEGTINTPLIATITNAPGDTVFTPSVENLTTGQGAVFDGLINAATGSLVIDGERHSATRGLDGVNTLMSNQFLIGGLDLEPGSNDLLIKKVGAGELAYHLAWVERFY